MNIFRLVRFLDEPRIHLMHELAGSIVTRVTAAEKSASPLVIDPKPPPNTAMRIFIQRQP